MRDDDDQEPSSDPFGPPESLRGERGMTYFGAIGWTLLSTSLFLFLLLLMVSIRSEANTDLITLFGLQLVSTLLTLRSFASRGFTPRRCRSVISWVFAARMVGFTFSLQCSGW